jgi:hypothetical protein
MGVTTMSTGSEQTSLLRRSLIADAAFSGIAAVILAAGAGMLAGPFGLPDSLLRGVGLSLVPYSILLAFLSTRSEHSLRFAWGIVAGNVLWSVLSVALLLSGWVDPTLAGTGFVLGQALAVAVFAEFQFFGLRRLR